VSASREREYRRGRSKLTLLLAAGAAFLLLIALGVWQLERRTAKLALIADREAGLSSPPAHLEAADADPVRFEFHRIEARGRFAHEHELYLTGQFLNDRPGWHVITPLLLDDGSALLVDRGYVSDAAKLPAARAEGQIAGPVTVEGILRLSTQPGLFTPANQPDRNLWFTRDAAAMAAAAGLPRVKSYFLVAGPAANPGGLPIGTPERVDVRNDHLQYAITWFALAGAVLVITILLVREKPGRAV
jgi:surfeit locus 1 family protein